MSSFYFHWNNGNCRLMAYDKTMAKALFEYIYNITNYTCSADSAEGY